MLSLATETIYDGRSLQSFITFVRSSGDDTKLRVESTGSIFYLEDSQSRLCYQSPALSSFDFRLSVPLLSD
nr:hypothetical protein CFP56_07371 [Quercus suber]